VLWVRALSHLLHDHRVALRRSEALREFMASRYRLIRLDHRGTGASQRKIDDYSLPTRIADFEAVLDALELDTCVSWAHFPIVPTAIAFAAAYPERVSRLVLSSPIVRSAQVEFATLDTIADLSQMDWRLYWRSMAVAANNIHGDDIERFVEWNVVSWEPDDYHRWREATFTGWDRDGGYAEFVAVRADFALRVPASFADLEAAPLLCGGVIGYRALRVSGIEPGGRLGLSGFGASAALAIQVAVHWGCEVFVVTRSPREQERALGLGAVWAGSYDETPPQRLDAAITFAPVGDAVVRALQALERGGTVAINAIHLDRIPQFDYDDLWWERQIRSVANFTRRDAQEFLDLAAQISIQTRPEPQRLGEANEALRRLKAGETEGALVLVP